MRVLWGWCRVSVRLVLYWCEVVVELVWSRCEVGRGLVCRIGVDLVWG